MSRTSAIDMSTSHADRVPAPMRRVTVPALRARKTDGVTAEPLVMLTAYTVRMAQLLDPHCDMLLVGDSLGKVIYGLASTVPVSLDMMCAHGAAVVRGSSHCLVVVDMPFGSYEGSPEQASRAPHAFSRKLALGRSSWWAGRRWPRRSRSSARAPSQ